MLKACGRACALAALGAFVVAGSGTANALTLNIIDYIDSGGAYAGVGEQAVTSDLNFNNPTEGVMVEAYGTLGSSPVIPTGYPTGSAATYAYLDGGGAGMGVCSGGLKSGNQCDTAADDNVGIGNNKDEVTEILSISFDNAWNVEDLLFRNEGHTPDFYDANTPAGSQKLDVAVDGVDLGGGVGQFFTFVLEDVSSGLGAGLVNWSTLNNLASTAFIHLRNNDNTEPRTQFYLSGIVLSEPGGSTTPIPLPAGIVLLLSGLMGLGIVGRFRKKLT